MIRALAWNTFAGLLRNRLIALFCGIFLCGLLLMMTPLLAFRSTDVPDATRQGMALSLLRIGTMMISGFGSLLAAWAAADAVAGEMKSGTILAVMARPVHRWQFLAGKWLGVQMLMLAYVVLMLGLTILLTRIVGERIESALWPFLVYPMLRYATYSALAVLLVTMMHPVFAFVAVLLTSVLASMVSPGSLGGAFLPAWLRTGIYYLIPSTNLLSEERFLAINQASLHAVPWIEHLTVITYGLDCAAAFLLLAMWSFRRRALVRE